MRQVEWRWGRLIDGVLSCQRVGEGGGGLLSQYQPRRQCQSRHTIAAAAAAGVEVEVEFGAPRPVAATASVPLTGIASWTNIWQTYVSVMPFPPNGQRAPFRRSRDAGVLLFLKSNVGNSNGMG